MLKKSFDITLLLKYFPRDIKIHGMDYLIYSDSIAIVQGGEDISTVVIKNKP